VKHNAQIDLHTKDGYSNAISYAARHGRVEIVEFLLKSGASPILSPKLKEWKILEFDDSVSSNKKKEILDILLAA
jgi:ankyrin repeat protein